MQLNKIKGVDFKYANMTIVFGILAQKLPNKTFFVPNLEQLLFCEIFQIDKFEGADFKYEKSFLKILTQKYRYKVFLVSNLAIFIISQSFAITPV